MRKRWLLACMVVVLLIILMGVTVTVASLPERTGKIPTVQQARQILLRTHELARKAQAGGVREVQELHKICWSELKCDQDREMLQTLPDFEQLPATPPVVQGTKVKTNQPGQEQLEGRVLLVPCTRGGEPGTNEFLVINRGIYGLGVRDPYFWVCQKYAEQDRDGWFPIP